MRWLNTTFLPRLSESPRRKSRRTWQNPRPEIEVASVDFPPQDVPSEPFLVALTAEP
jgi:hypothetical protein